MGEFATMLKSYGVFSIALTVSPMFGQSRCSPRSARRNGDQDIKFRPWHVHQRTRPAIR